MSKQSNKRHSFSIKLKAEPPKKKKCPVVTTTTSEDRDVMVRDTIQLEERLASIERRLDMVLQVLQREWLGEDLAQQVVTRLKV